MRITKIGDQEKHEFFPNGEDRELFKEGRAINMRGSSDSIEILWIEKEDGVHVYHTSGITSVRPSLKIKLNPTELRAMNSFLRAARLKLGLEDKYDGRWYKECFPNEKHHNYLNQTYPRSKDYRPPKSGSYLRIFQTLQSINSDIDEGQDVINLALRLAEERATIDRPGDFIR